MKHKLLLTFNPNVLYFANIYGELLCPTVAPRVATVRLEPLGREGSVVNLTAFDDEATLVEVGIALLGELQREAVGMHLVGIAARLEGEVVEQNEEAVTEAEDGAETGNSEE